MKHIKLYQQFVNESNINEARFLKADKIAAKEELIKFMKGFNESNKRSTLQNLAKKSGAEGIDQDTKYTYSPDGKLFVVYQYDNQDKVDDALYSGKGDLDKAKEKLKSPTFYYETSRPGYRIQFLNNDWTIAKIGRDGYPSDTNKLEV